ncbi:MAG: thiamine diphosphokinase [Actinomycetota bacterium]
MSKTVLVVAGGETPTPHVLRALPPAAMCIAADSGLDHARAAGLVPDLAVGDFDSASPEALTWARELGIPLEEHPAAKNQTDLELALDHAVAAEADRVVLAAFGGGRFDHLLANVAVIASPRYADVAVDGLVGTARVSVIHDDRTLDGRPDEVLSLLPVHGAAHGVTTDGLLYPLRGETLPAGTSRGVSNVFLGTEATVGLDDGILLAVQPDRLLDDGQGDGEGVPEAPPEPGVPVS